MDNDPEAWAKKKALDRIPTNSPSYERSEKEGAGGWSGSAHKFDYRLSARERKRILLDHIHGVDIDSNAVEVAKLNLMLKVLEGGTTADGTQRIAYDTSERLLPDLDKNIICGNSLIGTDYYSLFETPPPMSEAKRRGLGGGSRPDPGPRNPDPARINAMDWPHAFPDIMRRGGFDVVIGNPPYLFITELEQAHRDYYFQTYTTSSYRFDVYGLFIERLLSSRVVRDGGLMSFITPHTLLANDSYSKLRKLILRDATIIQVVDIGPGVFQNARNETMVFVFEKGKRSTLTNVVITDAKSFPAPTKEFQLSQETWAGNPSSRWEVKSSSDDAAIISKIEKARFHLGDLCTINQGLRTGDNEQFLSLKKKSGKWKKVVGGRDVGRYEPLIEKQFVLYDPNLLDAPRKPEIFDSASKIVVQEIRNIALPRRIIATYDNDRFYCLQSTNVINLRKEHFGFNMVGLLAILNSALVNFYFRQRFSGNNHIASNQLAQIPVPDADLGTLSNFAGQMLKLHGRFADATGSNRTQLERQIAGVDREIDRLVYQLYGLNESEIKIVEGEG